MKLLTLAVLGALVAAPAFGYANNGPPQVTPSGFVTRNGVSVATYSQPGDANSSSFASYHGGGIIGDVNIQLIFWGTAWANNTENPGQGEVQFALEQLIGTTYFEELGQYGMRTIGLHGVTLVNSDPPNPFATSDIDGLVWGMIDAGDFPEPVDQGGRILYVVLMPQNVSGPAGVFGSHHDPDRFDTDDLNGLQYAWVSWVSSGVLDFTTAIFSHEVAEAISDPESHKPAWLMDHSYNHDSNEIGDACDNAADRLNGIMVQAYWSENLKSCVIPFPAPPTLLSIYPPEGSPWGGDQIQINGINFDTQGNTRIQFGGIEATNINCTDSNTCYATTPPGNGAVNVNVLINDFTTATAAFVYVPTVTALSAQTGKAGDVITVYGPGIVSGAQVRFGINYSSSVDCRNPPGCQVVVPPGSGVVDVAVFSLNNWSRYTSNDLFSYAAPIVTYVSPASGPMWGGTAVTISGQGFDPLNDGGMEVLFGGVPSTNFSCYTSSGNNTSCLAYTPQVSAAGLAPVQVKVYGVESAVTSQAFFQFTPLPTMNLFYVDVGSASAVVGFDGNAPPGGAVVALHSSAPHLIRVQPQETVPGGSSSFNFPVKVARSTRGGEVTLTATYAGIALTQKTFIPATPLVALVFADRTLALGASTNGTVTLLRRAPAGGAWVHITATNSSGVSFPARVKVLQHQFSATFGVTNGYSGTYKDVAFEAHYAGHSGFGVVGVPAMKGPPICAQPPCL